MTWSWRFRNAIPALAIVLATAGCGGPSPAVQTPAPTGGLPSSQPTATSAATLPGEPPATEPGVTAEPTAGPTSPPDSPGETPLPEPSLTDPADISAALFESARVADGVVSLVDVMGIAVLGADGTLLRPGTDRGGGQLALTEGEVRGLIEMTEEDLLEQTESGGPFPLADMYAALQPGLPAGYSIDEFAADYAQAYADEPDSLAAQVMRGQTIDPSSGLLRVQMWLLLIDGFVGGAQPSVGSVGVRSHSLAVLARGSSVGTARQNLPPLTSPVAGLTGAEWAELVARMPTLAYSISFKVDSTPGLIHEGHGGPGDDVTFAAHVGTPPPLVSQRTGAVLLAPLQSGGAVISWDSLDFNVWDAHGTFDQPRGNPFGVAVTFTPMEEAANGAGNPIRELGSLYATVGQIDLVSHLYDLGDAESAAIELISGSRKAEGPDSFPIEWHRLGDGYWIKITWTDTYNGIADTINLRGAADTKDPSVEGVDAWLTGHGVAYGSRPGYADCANVDHVPSGIGAADFQAGIQGNEVVIAAWPQAETPLAGIFAGPFILPIEGGPKEQPTVLIQEGELCTHSLSWTIEAVRFGDP